MRLVTAGPVLMRALLVAQASSPVPAPLSSSLSPEELKASPHLPHRRGLLGPRHVFYRHPCHLALRQRHLCLAGIATADSLHDVLRLQEGTGTAGTLHAGGGYKGG